LSYAPWKIAQRRQAKIGRRGDYAPCLSASQSSRSSAVRNSKRASPN